MKKVLKTHKKKLQYVAPVFVLGALSVAVFGFVANSEPFIQDLEPFVLVAQDSVHLSDSTQTSSGDIASNKSIRISENGIINSSLFSDRIQLADNTSVNGSTTSNKLIKAQSAEIFGEQTDTIELPVIELPGIPNFQTGTLSHVIEEDTTLNPGNFNQIEVKEGITLTLTPGTYNLNKLILNDNSKLLYSEATIISVKNQLKIQSNTLVASNSATSTSTTDLQLNYTGKPPVIIGESSFVTAKILSPASRVQIGNKTTYLGQIFAKDINVGEEGVLSREIFFMRESNPNKIVTNADGVGFVVNEAVILFDETIGLQEIKEFVAVVDARVVGFLEISKIAKIQIDVSTLEELNSIIDQLKGQNEPGIIDVLPNIVIN